MQQKRILLFVALMLLLFGAWLGLQWWLFPPKPPGPSEANARESLGLALGLHPSTGSWDAGVGKAPPKEEPEKPTDFGFWDFKRMRQWAIAREPEPKPGTRITLGDDNPESPYHLQVVLDSRGAAVRKVLLNKFKATNEETGKPEPGKLLELVPDHNPNAPAFNNVLYHFVGQAAREDLALARPVDTLGKVNWKVSEDKDPAADHESVRFTTEIDGVEITKIFTLHKKEYHLGLEVQLRKVSKDDHVFFRYQLVGSQGLPIEGRWYTSIFRNALIGTVDDSGYYYRHLQDLRQIGVWGGGNGIERTAGDSIRYAGIADQYFASVIVVDKDNPTGQKFLTRARPTLEKALVKGKIVSITDDKVVIARTEHVSETFYFTNPLQHVQAEAAKDHPVALRVYTDPEFRPDDKGEPRSLIAEIETDPARFHPVWEDDITVRVATEPIELKEEPVVHKYLLYNGPVKPLLLSYVPENMGVAPALIDRYEERGLNTMTDFQSPGMMGTIASTIRWTWLVIHCTNVMHWVLNRIHWLIPSYGLSIICLTVLVRGMMFPISRKGAMTSLRMQELAPELKKLQEKHKDDPQAKGLAQMELYRKHGVSPFGTCWFMFLQMPIFMGLYYALQESITFRLAPFQPVGLLGLSWIQNLAAPDMLVEWGQSIPWLSSPDAYGGFLYLGPYLNVLPIIAVALMIMQQKMMTPPPTDEQQEMQQKMMKYMMVFMGLMFYKVAAGLCIYFIASSLWGFAERKLLPKKKPTTPTEDGAPPATSATLLSRVMGGAPPAPGTTAVTADAPSKGKGRRRGKDRSGVQREEPDEGGSTLQRMRRWLRRKRDGLSEWWAEVLKQAAKKER